MAYSRKSYSRYRNHGYEAAKRHIQEGQELSRQLGGTDEDVKAYFFSLRGRALSKVLDDYEKEYGTERRQYAQKTLNSWRTGRRQMSGLVASRLFSLLPKHMPLKKKYDLVDSLWEFCGSSSTNTLYIGKDVNALNLTDKVRSYFEENVKPHSINSTITKRFDWLAQNDSKLCQDLQNHFMHLQKEQLKCISYDRISVMLNQLLRDDVQHQTLRQSFTVGKHTLNLVFSTKSEGISESPPEEHDWGCLFLIVSVLLIFIISSIF